MADIKKIKLGTTTYDIKDTTKAPISHASSDTTYGIGTSSNYGHVKIKSGDLQGVNVASPPAGEVASSGHYHSQYASAQDFESFANLIDSGKQDTLVSGTNIKTINNQSILGSGNITISSGSSYTLPTASSSTKGGIKVGTGLSMLSETMSVSYGTTSTTAAVGNDSRFGKSSLSKIEYRDTGSSSDTKYYKLAMVHPGSGASNATTDPTATTVGLGYISEWVMSNSGYLRGVSLSLSGNLFVGGDSSTASTMMIDSVNSNVICNGDFTINSGKTLKFNKISAPTSSNGTTYGNGSSGQVLKSNGTTVYWANDNYAADTDKKTSSSNSTSKIYLVGATSQSTSGQTTYSNVGCYAQNGGLYSGSLPVINADTSGSYVPLHIMTITQANYNALSTKDSNTLYVIV